LRVTASAQSCSCQWILRFGYIEGGERHHLDVSNTDGEPFRTTGFAGKAKWFWTRGGWQRER
jgi:hypothetical protein